MIFLICIHLHIRVVILCQFRPFIGTHIFTGLSVAIDSVAADQVDDVTGSNLTSQLESELSGEMTEVLPSTASLASSKVLATPAVRRIASENRV